MTPAFSTGGRAVAVDLFAVAVVGLAICLAADRLAPMTVLVPAVVVARTIAWSRLPASQRGHALWVEVAALAGVTVLGAFNDWSSVVRHGVYDYAVPHYVAWSTIPVWMLLYWGLILRFLATLFAWGRLGAPGHPGTLRLGRTRLSAPGVRVAIELALVLATRQAIYRAYLDPLWSWLPFAAALALYVALFGLGGHGRRLVALLAVVGPLVEIAFIQLGGLHRYHLGWLGGVPLWIVLWWVLGGLVWSDLSRPILAWLRERFPAVAQHGTMDPGCCAVDQGVASSSPSR